MGTWHDAWTSHSGDGADLSSIALASVSLGLFRILEEAGFTAQVFCGHSLGEFAALAASGYLSEREFNELVCRRAKCISDHAGHGADGRGGGMVAVLSEAGFSQLRLPPHVWVANFNSPSQYVLTGRTSTIASAAELGVPEARLFPLKVSAPFHSPLMADANRSFAYSIHHLPLKGPSPTEKGAAALPVVLCGAVGAPYDVTQTSGNKSLALRENLLQHMEAPVKFVETINHAYEKQGARLFVEFGPRATCGKLVRQILAKRAEEVEVVSLGADMNNTELGLRKAIAHLAVLGADLLTFDPWAAPSVPEASERSPFEHTMSGPSFIGKKRKAELQRVMNDGFLLGPTGASGSVRAERAELLQSPALCTLGDQPAAVHTVPAKSESGAGREAEEIKQGEKGELAKHKEECNVLY